MGSRGRGHRGLRASPGEGPGLPGGGEPAGGAPGLGPVPGGRQGARGRLQVC
ncbi:MAG: hypothetical protein M3118_08040 [Actinomycetota bacterium]|nr:hypothetical protein [Actinomycetota bacterium]